MSKTKEALKHILDAAKALMEIVSKERAENPNPTSNEQPSSDERHNMPQPAASGSQPQSHIEPQIDTKPKWYKTVDGVRLILEFCAFGLACVACGIYNGQMQANRKQAYAAGRQLDAMSNQYAAMVLANDITRKAVEISQGQMEVMPGLTHVKWLGGV